MKRTLTVLSMAGMLLAGCADMKGIGPSAKLQEANDLGLPTTSSADAQVLGPSIDWWTSFGDPQLDHLVAQALTGNPSLRMAAARVAKAQAGVELARSADWPQVNGQLDLNRQKFSSNHIYPAPLGGPS
ncbi:TolC family protein [Ottowia caeni]|uniref:TolC family protein n=1 Tax=Ottowia caeni TaxID=2870339 RepID=UPI003D740787